MMLKHFPILYKLSNAKKIIIWKIDVIQQSKCVFIQITRGQENGKMVVTKKEIKKGKGKKSIIEQAIFDATSKWNAKITQQGYLEDKKKAQNYV